MVLGLFRVCQGRNLFFLFHRKRLPHASGPVAHAAVAAGHSVHPEPGQTGAGRGQGDEHSEFHGFSS